jgi:glycosyltransferase involved in cell wall biosynthesis
MRVAAVVPAYRAAPTVAEVVRGLTREFQALGEANAGVIVVDDGSDDETAERALAAGAEVVRHPENRGKGQALLTGFRAARERGADAVVSVDADGQHLPDQALIVARAPAPRDALVLGIRDLVRAGAPSANRFSNRFSNVFLSFFSGRRLRDTQCGLRRYPLPETLELGLESSGYELESEVILKAAGFHWRIVEVPVEVYYPPEAERVSHFHVVRDPARIVARVVSTVASLRLSRPA